jgi:hypothetical protein
MSDLEWLNFCIDEARNFGHTDKADALGRIRARIAELESAAERKGVES